MPAPHVLVYLPPTPPRPPPLRARQVYLKSPLCIGGLLQQVQANPEPGVRQIAAVVLRKKIGSHWGKLDAASQATVQGAMLQCLQTEGERTVRKGVVGVVAAVANQCFSTAGVAAWPDLLQFINACTGAADLPDAREMGYHIIQEVGHAPGSSWSTRSAPPPLSSPPPPRWRM